ncbi:GTP cyclohydrolase II [Companilactobacillus halodurans]|uniref:GTP cyclohydrolase-2 n=1 Tax=Companilactobacillus halodurans TaxID=2584183 RepID=A0A5P0ZWH2_9LACO|nr:GTP cyclohydrolase II [Companilactobacillus halodurans]MQS74860.1 GTP cyclohydrolase II [Companilactobacillus halodurans]MQS97255.1 GTP cyclohydrolase II [Companilactobacillus halodurans]
MRNQIIEKVKIAIEDLKAGKLIIVADSPDRESEGDMIGLADFVKPENVNFMITHARGLLCVPMSKEFATRLNLEPMTKSHDAFNTAFTISTDVKTTTTGISAFDRAKTISQLANPTSQAQDFYHPGHIFPLVAKDNGVMQRTGHTEAAVDLAKIAGANPVSYICEVIKKDGTMARLKDLRPLAKKWHLNLITIHDLIEYRYMTEQDLLKEDSDVDLPTRYGHFRLRSYLTKDDKSILLIYKGQLKADSLLRIHSECFTGDIFGSKRCDCGAQLEESLKKIENNGSGMLIYLHQEGRGIGLINKLKAYRLQDEGNDTVEANLKLGFKADARNYGLAVNLLNKLQINEVSLMTNNPDKINQLERLGIKVTKRIPLEIVPNEIDLKYLQTKKNKFNHMLKDVE